MTTVCVGVHVHAEPLRFAATLASLDAHTGRTFELVLLPDGPDQATQLALAKLAALRPDMPQLATREPCGPPACFNRLAAHSRAEVLVLLESGSQVGPGWLDLLLAAFSSHEAAGLAGPSTNLAWNEQGVFYGRGDTPAEIRQTAAEAAARYGTLTRTLEPLYSLADFCYAVRREVVQSVGAAEERFGLGPCWEMDYNIRAARAGYRGVWACGAYVHRAPFTARRQREESLRFEQSKRLYQDKFCGLRLRRERPDYEPHCRGDACPHFAPRSLIQIHLPPTLREDGAVAPAVTRLPAASIPTYGPQAPMISCIMPTRDRPAYLRQAIRYFQRQDYPERELIIVDDSVHPDDRLEAAAGEDSRIRYLRVPPGTSIGAKRNLACEMARGSIIAHWDDDDWYGANRLSAQAAPLLDGSADITGLRADVFFDLPSWQFWRCRDDLHRRLFVQDVHGGTLMYRRRVWQESGGYPDLSLAEDAAFLSWAVRRGFRLERLKARSLHVYVRHGTNAWTFAAGQYVDPAGWLPAPEPPFPPEDRAFYAALSPAAPVREARPLVTCIMPTGGRLAFASQAVRYFLAQDYVDAELVIVDGGPEPVVPLFSPDPRIRCLAAGTARTVGARRNLACEAAAGDVIVHWDDDDWQAPDRLSRQLRVLLESGADLCGSQALFYYDMRAGKAWRYAYGGPPRPWLAGNTLCYRRSYWAAHRFEDVDVAEDALFVAHAAQPQVAVLDDSTYLVGITHGSNVSPKETAGPWWHPYPADDIQRLVGGDWDFYVPGPGSHGRR